MNAFGALVGMGVHGTLGASATTDFGKKGMLAGGVFGAGSYLLGEKITEEDQGVTGAIASGFITGSMQSAFSSAQEIYAFHNPGHISNVSSINTTTSATAMAHSMYAPFSKEGREQWKDLRKTQGKGIMQSAFDMFNTNMLTSENTLTDATRLAMINNDTEAAADKMMRLMGLSRDEGKFSPIGALKGQYSDMWEAANVADDGGQWFGNKATDIDVQSKTFFGQHMDKDGRKLTGEYFDKDGKSVGRMDAQMEAWGSGKEKWLKDNNIDMDKTKWYVAGEDVGFEMPGTKSASKNPIKIAQDTAGANIESKAHVERVSLTGNETISERMGLFLDANKNAYESAIVNKAAQDRAAGGNPRFDNFDDYKKYVTSMDGGALGTYQELKRGGFYDKDAPKMKQLMAYGTETMYGSPQWARTLDKQLENGTASLENYTDDAGNKKVRINGGGKRRIMSLIADVATGGGINAAANVGIWAATQPFKGGGDRHAVNANNAVNPI